MNNTTYMNIIIHIKNFSRCNALLPSEVIWFTMLLESGDISQEIEVNSGISKLLYYILQYYTVSL